MQQVFATLTLQLEEKTWQCRTNSNPFRNGWSEFNKDYFDLYPHNFCKCLNLKEGTAWEQISKIKILKVENARLEEAGVTFGLGGF